MEWKEEEEEVLEKESGGVIREMAEDLLSEEEAKLGEEELGEERNNEGVLTLKEHPDREGGTNDEEESEVSFPLFPKEVRWGGEKGENDGEFMRGGRDEDDECECIFLNADILLTFGKR